MQHCELVMTQKNAFFFSDDKIIIFFFTHKIIIFSLLKPPHIAVDSRQQMSKKFLYFFFIDFRYFSNTYQINFETLRKILLLSTSFPGNMPPKQMYYIYNRKVFSGHIFFCCNSKNKLQTYIILTILYSINVWRN